MINTKQRAYLRSLANNVESLYQIGKGGVTETVISSLDSALTARELIKVSVLEACPEKAGDVLAICAAKLGAEPVQAIGRKIVLYRQSEKEENRKINLPRL